MTGGSSGVEREMGCSTVVVVVVVEDDEKNSLMPPFATPPSPFFYSEEAGAFTKQNSLIQSLDYLGHAQQTTKMSCQGWKGDSMSLSTLIGILISPGSLVICRPHPYRPPLFPSTCLSIS
jgi:hypothetical protein